MLCFPGFHSMVTNDNKTKMAGDEGNSWPRKDEATEYLQKHKILELFNNLTSELMYHRPGG